MVMSDQVDDNIFVEGGPPLRSNLTHVHDGLGVISIDMEDGRVYNSGHIGGVWGGAGHSRVRGEANLSGNHHSHHKLNFQMPKLRY